MNIYYLDNVDDIYELKMKVEKHLLYTKEITEKLKLEEFIIKYCDVSKKVYVKDSKNIIPFGIIDIEDEKNVILLKKGEYNEDLLNKLELMEYKFDNIINNNVDLIQEFSRDNVEDMEYFIINGKFCKC